MLKKLVTTTALVAAIAAGAAFRAPAHADDTITIGMQGPLTGELAAYGEQLRRGAEAAVRDINAKGGVMGKQLKIVAADDEGKPDKGPLAAQQLIKQGVVFVDGPFQSGVAIPSSATYSESGILMITPSATNVRLTDEAAQKGWQTIMRVCGRDDGQGAFAGPWIAKTYKGKKIAIYDDGSPYGAGLASETKKNLLKAGGKVADEGRFASGDKDFTAMVNKLKQKKINVLYIGGYHPEEALILKQAREAGWKGALISGDALNTQEFATIAGKDASGKFVSDGVRFSDASSALNLASAKSVVAQFRKDGYEPEGYTLLSYASVQSFAAGANGAKSTDGAKVAAWLRGHPVDTVVGKISWDKKGDRVHSPYSWFIFKDGKFEPEPTN
ncbi:MAG TPA: branched-chain amino acid ABC transporter substrate-binding protein [Dongiaceae bacterium]|jgi:branched-chain amino acid transport system substrate-binding protein|nr:branched-chain amino acid ABC transporter substrate-binding protein [Dongiaceae bacterium]